VGTDSLESSGVLNVIYASAHVFQSYFDDITVLQPVWIRLAQLNAARPIQIVWF